MLNNWIERKTQKLYIDTLTSITMTTIPGERKTKNKERERERDYWDER